MEYWISKMDDEQILVSDPCHHHKRSISFRWVYYFNTPIFHHAAAHDQGSADAF